MNTFGLRFRFTTFGESHGVALGCVVDGVPAGLKINLKFIQSELDRRRPGKSKYETSRKEGDKVEIVSGVFEGKSTGTPIAMIIYNENQKSNDYANIKDLFRPAHADFTYFHKYGIRDYRGGGRSSARETAARVAAGAIAKLMLKELGIVVESGIVEVGDVRAHELDYTFAKSSMIFALDLKAEEAQKKVIDEAREAHDSVGGVVSVRARNLPIGLGEPMYHKLDGVLADAMMGINGVKAVDIGEGFNTSKLKGSQNNDEITPNGFVSNHAGGILGGISNGDKVEMKVYFKPTPSIFKPLHTVDIQNHEQILELKGRHDPCIAIRGSVVVESMMALVLADMVLLNMGSRMQSVKRVYKKRG